MCRTPGCARPPSLASARSSTAFASVAADPEAGSPVTWSHSAHGVRFISASANSAATSRSSGWRWYASRMATAYAAFQAEQSAAGLADGYREVSVRASARSTGEASSARLSAAADAANARDTDDDLSTASKDSHGLL